MANSLEERVLDKSKELARLDAQSKQLRAEVSSLEMSRHAQEMMHRAKELRDEAERKQPLTTTSPGGALSMSASSPEQNRATRKVNRMVRKEGEQEFYDALNRKICEARASLKQLNETVSLESQARLELEESDKVYQRNLAVLEKMYDVAQWRPGSSSPQSRECPIVVRDEHNRQRKRLLDLYEDRSTIESQLKLQLTQMNDLAAQVEAQSTLQETLDALQTEVAVLEMEERSVQDEIDTLQRLLRRKDRLWDTSRGRSEVPIVKELETVKRLTNKKLQGHKEQIQTNDAAILHRAATISKLLLRIETIGDALGGEDAKHRDRVDVDVVESLRQESEVLQKDATANDAKLSALDRDMEDLESRVRTLQNATRVTESEEQRRRRDHERQTRLVRERLEQQKIEAAAYLDGLEQEVNQIRSAHGSRSQSQRSGSGGVACAS